MNQLAGLRKIRSLVDSYQHPSVSFNPYGAWEHQYDLYIIAYAMLFSQGTIRIARKPMKEGARLDVLTVRPTMEPNLYHYTEAQLECSDNQFSSPQRWTVSTKIAGSESAEPYFNSGMTKQSAYDHGMVQTSTNGKAGNTIHVDVPYGCKYALLDAVQRLPPDGKDVLPEFGLFDEYDQIRFGYHLQFRETVPVQLKNEVQPLSLYTLTGPGQIPASYWKDKSGRLLFFVSGIEVYVLAEENGRPIEFRKTKDVFRKSVELTNAEGK
jgi:hypothetical protein